MVCFRKNLHIKNVAMSGDDLGQKPSILFDEQVIKPSDELGTVTEGTLQKKKRKPEGDLKDDPQLKCVKIDIDSPDSSWVLFCPPEPSLNTLALPEKPHCYLLKISYSQYGMMCKLLLDEAPFWTKYAVVDQLLGDYVPWQRVVLSKIRGKTLERSTARVESQLWTLLRRIVMVSFLNIGVFITKTQQSSITASQCCFGTCNERKGRRFEGRDEFRQVSKSEGVEGYRLQKLDETRKIHEERRCQN